MHELHMSFSRTDASQPAALGMVRQLRALVELEIKDSTYEVGSNPVQWPSFIPPSLRALCISVFHSQPVQGSLLGALPGMLVASGARLDRLKVVTSSGLQSFGDELFHVAQALRCCATTLNDFRYSTGFHPLDVENGTNDPSGQFARMRVQCADLMTSLASCRELQLLVLLIFMVEPLFPPGTAFGRLTHLEMADHEREHPPGAGVMGLWELMASGGLPALTKLRLSLEGRWGAVEQVRTRVAPAFEAVASTLAHLHLERIGSKEWLDGEVDVGYELGKAVGKLRRLKDLWVGLTVDGRVYQAIARGFTASGGDNPLPLLWRVGVSCAVEEADADLPTSLLLPSVRVFSTECDDKPLLIACAVRQAGYEHILALDSLNKTDTTVRAVVEPCTIGEVYSFVHCHSSWTQELGD
jgi:hypothetical protein